MGEHVWWYVARAAGMVTFGLSAATVIWGLLLSTRLLRRRSLPKWLLDLHRFLGGLTIAFLVLHVGALIADSTVHFGAADVLVPFASSWRPLAVAGGVIAAWLLVAVESTSLARRWLPRRLWSRVHLSSFVAFVLSVGHTVMAGTDVGNRVFIVGAFLVCAVVFFLVAIRVLASVSPPPRGSRRPESSPPRKGTTPTWT